VQVDPMKPALKAPGTNRLRLMCDILLSTFAFNFNLRRFSEGDWADLVNITAAAAMFGEEMARMGGAVATGRGLHSFTSQLNLSAFYGIGGERRACVARVQGVLGGV